MTRDPATLARVLTAALLAGLTSPAYAPAHPSMPRTDAHRALAAGQVPPSTQATSVSASDITASQAALQWTRGDGDACVVFVRQSLGGNAAPSDNATYNANSTFGQGAQIGATGWYCVYNGAGAGVTVTGLAATTTYRVMVCEYNGGLGDQLYLISTAAGNPANFTTIATPTVVTGEISDVTATTAACGGNVTSDGGGAVTARGVCWSAGGTPTIADSHTSDGDGSGAFTSALSGLSPETAYSVRAYATNAAGTAYGDVASFTTAAAPIPPSEPPPEPDPAPGHHLVLTIRTEQAEAIVGQRAAFRVTLSNEGAGDAGAVELLIELPDSVEFVSAQLPAGGAAQPALTAMSLLGRQLRIVVSAVRTGSALELRIVVRPTSRGLIALVASARTADGAIVEAQEQVAGAVAVSADASGGDVPHAPLCGAAGPLPLGLLTAGLITARAARGRRGFVKT
ncbi:MAG: DUF11 domain-containing protein [Phycisphaerae bacterium]|nr:hypothetical protein [Phycisphaerae bacterium]MCZ2400862.1 DUF11 domain-containing protein [Phycisphaerae bacterium]NUQ48787.1 hypothetical protein [Phycisphaerae bacterium]